MNQDWKKYLINKGANYTEETSFLFKDENAGNLTDQKKDRLCDLSQYSTLVIAGDDAETFMQGQFTNDVQLVDENSSQINAFCNNKGRMMANFRLFQLQQNYFCSIKNSLVAQSIEHLQRYILRAQVVIQDVSDQLIHLGLSGANAEKLLQPFLEINNHKTEDVSFNENYFAIRVAGAQPRYEIFCSFEHAQSLWNKISKQAEIVNGSHWEHLNIQAGLPFIDSKNSAEFVPQMLNMDLINGVSFTKGCFTGQEIVARMHYLGTLKRRCYRVKIQSGSRPETGDLLATETSAENQFIGRITNVCKTSSNEYEALAVIQIKSAENEKLFLAQKTSEIALLELPYELTKENK